MRLLVERRKNPRSALLRNQIEYAENIDITRYIYVLLARQVGKEIASVYLQKSSNRRAQFAVVCGPRYPRNSIRR